MEGTYKKQNQISVQFTVGELQHLAQLTAQINEIADAPRRISRGHVVRAIIAMAGNAKPERILKHLPF